MRRGDRACWYEAGMPSRRGGTGSACSIDTAWASPCGDTARSRMIWGDKSKFAIECLLSEDPIGMNGAVYGTPIIWISGYGLGDSREETTLGGFARFLRAFMERPESGLESFVSMPAVQLFHLAYKAMFEPEILDDELSMPELYDRPGGCFFNDSSTVLDGYWCIWQRVNDDVRFIGIPYFVHSRDFMIDRQVHLVEVVVPFQYVTDIMNACVEWINELRLRGKGGPPDAGVRDASR